MGRSDAEWAAWAKQHRVAFEVAPLVELREGDAEKVQVGYTLTLYAEIPMEKAPGNERQEAGRVLREELRAFLQDAVPPDKREAGAELEMPRTAVLRPENDLRPEIGLTWRLFHKDEYLKPVDDADRQRLGSLERRLVQMGLKHGHW
jgi:hypothetical protein